MEDYKPNSNRFKEEIKKEATAAVERRAKKVASGKIRKNEVRKLTDVFLAKDVHEVKEYIITEVAIPAIKNIIMSTVNAFLYGDTQGKTRTNASRASYQDFYSGRDRERNVHPTEPMKKKVDYRDLVFESKGEAEEVLSALEELISMYGKASVADLFDLADMECDYTENRYGWKSLATASTFLTRDGYMLRLPKPRPLD